MDEKDGLWNDQHGHIHPGLRKISWLFYRVFQVIQLFLSLRTELRDAVVVVVPQGCVVGVGKSKFVMCMVNVDQWLKEM